MPQRRVRVLVGPLALLRNVASFIACLHDRVHVDGVHVPALRTMLAVPFQEVRAYVLRVLLLLP